MDIDQYLKKINLKAKTPTLNFLNEIISAHQKTISFNNLSVFYRPGQILNLKLEALFEKVILQGKGGYCFENNKVLYYLLKYLGFEVEAKAARVLYNNPGDVPRTHRMTIVMIEGERYLADVGFGRDVPTRAIKIGIQQNSGHQVIMKDELYRLELLKSDSLIDLYTFDDGRYQESDFDLGNYYTNTHPDSKFLKELIVTRIDQNLIEFIKGRTYTKIEKGERVDSEIKNQNEFQMYLKRFGIEDSYDFSKILA